MKKNLYPWNEELGLCSPHSPCEGESVLAPWEHGLSVMFYLLISLHLCSCHVMNLSVSLATSSMLGFDRNWSQNFSSDIMCCLLMPDFLSALQLHLVTTGHFVSFSFLRAPILFPCHQNMPTRHEVQHMEVFTFLQNMLLLSPPSLLS